MINLIFVFLIAFSLPSAGKGEGNMMTISNDFYKEANEALNICERMIKDQEFGYLNGERDKFNKFAALETVGKEHDIKLDIININVEFSLKMAKFKGSAGEYKLLEEYFKKKITKVREELNQSKAL